MASLSIAQGLARAYGQPKGREEEGKQEKGKRQGKNSGRKGKKLQGSLLMIKQWNAFCKERFWKGKAYFVVGKDWGKVFRSEKGEGSEEGKGRGESGGRKDGKAAW